MHPTVTQFETREQLVREHLATAEVRRGRRLLGQGELMRARPIYD